MHLHFVISNSGFNDNVKCFFCDGGLRNWDPGDDGWEEHARWFPRCQFVLQVKGQEFINEILQKHGGEIQIPGYSGGVSIIEVLLNSGLTKRGLI